MRRRKGREWFPIVATDFFCGLLAVVVVLDAAAPRTRPRSGVQTQALVRIEGVPKEECSKYQVLIAVEGVGDAIRAKQFSPDGAGNCIYHPSVKVDVSAATTVKMVVLAASKNAVVTVRLGGREKLRCSANSC